MSDCASKVIGYFASRGDEVVCTGAAACLIAGSAEAMTRHLQEVGAGGGRTDTVRKTRFGEILRGLARGGAYAFDEQSYARFYPLARAQGLPVQEADFASAQARGDRYLTVQLIQQCGSQH